MPRTLRRWLAPAALASLAAAVVGCGGKPPATSSTTPGSVAPAAEVGSPLYAAADVPKAFERAPAAEDVVIPQAIVQYAEKIVIAAEVDGTIEVIGTPLPQGTKPDANAIASGLIVPHPREETSLYRRLIEDNPIQVNQTLVRMDDSQIAIQLDANVKTVASMKKRLGQAQLNVDLFKEILERVKKNSGGIGGLEVASYQSQLAKSEMELSQVEQDITRLEGETKIAEKKGEQYRVKSKVDGRVIRILKSRGEFVKAGEPLLEVQATARFTVEGKMDSQEADRLKPGMPVSVEPVRAVSAEPYTARHRQEVTGVAVTAHPGQPLVVSASLDGTALVWDVLGAKRAQHALPHPPGVGVRCVAVGGGADSSRQWAVTGGTDGRVRLWDLTDPAALPAKPTAEFEETHAQAVTAAGFSPDGRYLATAAGREVYVWDLAARKRLYSLPAEHRNDVTAVRFTPQATLVTVSRDRTVRVWKVGDKGAAAVNTLDHRSGAVDVVGVSADGGRVLFDQDAGRIDMVSLADGRTTGSLLNAGGGMRFGGLAAFGGGDHLVLTATGDTDTQGELQLWRVDRPDAKAPGQWVPLTRGEEWRRLVTPGRAAVTCAAFSTDPAKRFVAVGTQSGVVHFWMLPADAAETSPAGKIVSVLPFDAKTSLVRVEVDNAGGKLTDLLKDRGTASIVVKPDAKPEVPAVPPPGAAPRPLPGGASRPIGAPAGGDVLPVGALVDPTNGGLVRPLPER